MRIAVAGGTGVVGRHVVEAVRALGHEPVVMARSTGVNVATGEGLDAALERVQSVIDASNVFSARSAPSVEFFTTATQNMIAAGTRAGVSHHVVLSIVGIDRIEYGYYIAKRAHEKAALDSGAAVSVLRATQFHEFPGQLLDRTATPVALIPTMRSQPVAASEVGTALATLAAGPAVGRAPDLAGPEVHLMPELARRLLRHRGSHRPVLPLRVPGAVGKGMRTGALLPETDGPRGVITFDQWLATQP